jgi:3-methyladenine DNA glycosylase AlkD
VPQLAIQMKKYMRDQFEYFGIPSPRRKEIVKEVFGRYKPGKKSEFIDFIETCWAQPQREYKYAAMDVSIRQLKRMDSTFIPFYEKLIANDSWWDTVDGLAPQIIGSLIKKNIGLRSEYCLKWIESDNFWYQRSAIILQLMFRNQTDFELLKKLILRRADSKEFFVRKASGWALRQYSKFEPEAVHQFILQNKNLSGLTVREGMKIILRKERR